MKRLMIVADHPFVVQSTRLALRQTAGFQVVGAFDGREPLRGPLVELTPDLVLVDDMASPTRALTRLAEIHEHAPAAQALLMTSNMAADWLGDAFTAGAAAIVSTTLHPASLATLLRELGHGTVLLREHGAEVAGVDPPRHGILRIA